MNNERVVVFAKEKSGLHQALNFLRRNFCRVDLFKGDRLDAFPSKAYDRKYDICVSYMSPWVIPGDFLSGISGFSINFHPGTPKYRGIGCTNFAIYNNERKYGVTAHLMVPNIDSGKIIDVKYFRILPGDSLLDVTKKCYQYILMQFYDIFKYYFKHARLPLSHEKWSRHLYTRAELDRLCRITPKMPLSEVKRRIKATDFPNMPKAYVKMFGYRFEYKE